MKEYEEALELGRIGDSWVEYTKEAVDYFSTRCLSKKFHGVSAGWRGRSFTEYVGRDDNGGWIVFVLTPTQELG